VKPESLGSTRGLGYFELKRQREAVAAMEDRDEDAEYAFGSILSQLYDPISRVYQGHKGRKKKNIQQCIGRSNSQWAHANFPSFLLKKYLGSPFQRQWLNPDITSKLQHERI
jgi:hypothetical protein